MTDDLVITMDDIRRAGHCPAGARTWFKLHGFDFKRFLKQGISAEELLATGDEQATHVVAIAREASVG